jgi:hypothetical protein
MRQLVGLTAGDEAARAGLQRAVVDYILRDLTSTTRAAGAETTALRPDALQRLLRRSEPALAQLFNPEQVESIRRIAADLQRMNLDTRSSGGWSDTAQNLAAQKASAGRVGSIIDRARQYAPFGAPGLGFLFYGWEAATAGAMAAALHGARMAGIRTVDDLVVRAMLDPGVARVLYAKVTPRNQDALLRRLGERLARSARIGGVVGSGETDKPPRSAAAMPISRPNALFGGAGRQPVMTGSGLPTANRLLAVAG